MLYLVKNLSCPLKVVLTSSQMFVWLNLCMATGCFISELAARNKHPDTFQYIIHEKLQGDLLCPLRLYLTPSQILNLIMTAQSEVGLSLNSYK